MAIYRQGKKLIGIYRQGKAFTGIHRGGRQLWGIEKEPMVMHGLKLAFASVEDEMYFNYALDTTTRNQKDYYVDLMLGVKSLRLAGDTTGRIRGEYSNGYISWYGAELTDENIWVGKVIEATIKADSNTITATDVEYPVKGKAVYTIKDAYLTPNTLFKASVRVYNSTGSAMTINMQLNDVNVYSGQPEVQEKKTHYITSNNFVGGTYISANTEWMLPASEYELSREAAKLTIEVNYKNLESQRQNVLTMENPPVERTIKLTVKGIIR